MPRELLMLAKAFDQSRHQIGGWFASIKYDGQRAFWDGGVSRGILKSDIPWANTRKDNRYKEPPVATGLWSRYGNVIHAPDSFLDQLPENVFLDGELWVQRRHFQETRKIVSTLVPGPGWEDVKFLVFDSPPPEAVFQTGQINNLNFVKQIREVDCRMFLNGRVLDRHLQFTDVPSQLERFRNDLIIPVLQHQLPWSERAAKDELQRILQSETELGGEGLMIRHPNSYWAPKRIGQLLKVKKLERDMGKVVGYMWGERGVEDKLFGLMGAVVVEYHGKQFKLSGFTEDERVMHIMPCTDERADEWGKKNPGGTVEPYIWNPKFPRDSEIHFYHSGMTDESIPREARYARPKIEARTHAG